MTFVAATPGQDVARPRGGDALPADVAPGSRGPDGQDSLSSGDSLRSRDEAAVSRQVDTLTRRLEAADSDSRRDEIRSKLAEAHGQQFDERQKRHGREI